MINVFLLSFFTESRSEYMTLMSGSPAIALRPFGLRENASFYFYVLSQYSSTIDLFLVPHDMYAPISLEGGAMQELCNGDSRHISPINKSSKYSTNFFSWEGTVDSTHLYHPLILNCKSRPQNYNIEFSYRNPHTFLDYRDSPIPFVYFLISIANCALSVLWSMNCVEHLEFSIPIYRIMEIIPILKAASSGVSSFLWFSRSLRDNSEKWLEIMDVSMFSLYHMAILVSIGLATSGWGIFRNALTSHEFIEILSSSMMLSCGYALFSKAKSQKEDLISMILISCGFIWFLKLCSDYYYVILQLRDNFRECIILRSKFKLIKHFCASCLTSVVLGLVLNSLFLIFDLWKVCSLCIFESVLLYIHLAQYFYFSLRVSYRGEAFPALPASVACASPRLVEFRSPAGPEISILSTNGR